jgi:hypothetical protein
VDWCETGSGLRTHEIIDDQEDLDGLVDILRVRQVGGRGPNGCGQLLEDGREAEEGWLLVVAATLELGGRVRWVGVCAAGHGCWLI